MQRLAATTSGGGLSARRYLASGRGRVIPFGRRRDADAQLVIAVVAAARRVPALLLVHRSRCNAEVAAARQLAMYLMHVVLARSLTSIGRCFGRDRTTVSHACAQVEDRRDAPLFDAEVASLEEAIAAGLQVDGEEGCNAAD